MDLKNIGLRFKQLREEKNMKQKEFALAIGVAPNDISRIETAKNKDVPTAILIKVANFCGAYSDWILTGTGNKYRRTLSLEAEIAKETEELVKNNSKEELALVIKQRESQILELKKGMKDLLDKI